jgi:DNA primase
MPLIDVQTIRASHSIENIVLASGVHLRSSGRSFMACCPFHADDRTPSMSVGGVPGRYHCFACGAGGDVIDYVARFNDIGFRDAAERLISGTPFDGRAPAEPPTVTRPGDAADPNRTSTERIYAINELAWRHFTAPTNLVEAEQYLIAERGIDVAAIRRASNGEPVVGYAAAEWRQLADALLASGVTAAELVDADLAHRRDERLIDAYRGRVVVPVRASDGRIEGFIGRDVTGDPRSAKYRNPTTTATFDKSQFLYRPTHHNLTPVVTVVVVEGVMDALAITATAAAAGELSSFAPCTTSGVAVSTMQAQKVLALSDNPAIIALDGDDAGAEGTQRWIEQISITLGRPVLSTRLPDGFDPAEWLANRGAAGLAAFDRRGCLDASAFEIRPRLNGAEVVHAIVRGTGNDEPFRDVHEIVAAAAATLGSPRAADEFLRQADREMRERHLTHDRDRGRTSAVLSI